MYSIDIYLARANKLPHYKYNNIHSLSRCVWISYSPPLNKKDSKQTKTEKQEFGEVFRFKGNEDTETAYNKRSQIILKTLSKITKPMNRFIFFIFII